MTDKESQIDEILVLESIYNEEEFQRGEEKGMISGQFNVFLELPASFSVSYRDLENCDEKVTRNIHLAHLPPISLSFRLPPDYPSKSPPITCLRCMWLNSSLIKKLINKLEELWRQNEGMEILYLWMNFLKEESLQFLEISDNLDITLMYSSDEKKQIQRGINNEESNPVPTNINTEDRSESKIPENQCVPTKECDTKCSTSLPDHIKTEFLDSNKKNTKTFVTKIGLTDNNQTDIPAGSLEEYSAQKDECLNRANRGYSTSSRGKRFFRSSDRNGPTHTSMVFTNSSIPKNSRYRSSYRYPRWNSRFTPSTSRRPDYRSKNVTSEPESKVPLINSLCNNNNINTINDESNKPSNSCIVVNNILDDNKRTYESGSNVSSEKLETERNEETVLKQVPTPGEDKKQKRLRTHIIDYLIKYDEERTKTEFERNIFTCNICFDDKLGIKSIQFMPCKHVYCRDCTSDYFDVRIKEGYVTSMPCPHDKCKSEATQHQIRDLIGPDKFAHYDSLLLSATLSTMADITYCPRTACQSPVMREPDEKMAACPACQYVFCVYCKMTYHGVERCRMKEEEKKKLVDQYMNGDDESQRSLEALYGKRQIIDLVNSFMSEVWISQNSKPCPSCTSAIEKSDGCNKMVCRKCNTFFCWLCGQILDHVAPYKHFNDTMSKCYNLLFEGVDDPLNRDGNEVEVFYF